MGYNCNGRAAGEAGRNKGNVGGMMGSRCSNNNVAGNFNRRCNNNVGGVVGNRFNCEDVFECLLELLEDALEEMRCRCRCNNNTTAVSPICGNSRCFGCIDVFECLSQLLDEALEDDNCRKNR